MQRSSRKGSAQAGSLSGYYRVFGVTIRLQARGGSDIVVNVCLFVYTV